jgi:hypothetical protein
MVNMNKVIDLKPDFDYAYYSRAIFIPRSGVPVET